MLRNIFYNIRWTQGLANRIRALTMAIELLIVRNENRMYSKAKQEIEALFEKISWRWKPGISNGLNLQNCFSIGLLECRMRKGEKKRFIELVFCLLV